MSAYRDFVRDFPARCIEVLDLASGRARYSGREVTLLLMTASTSLVVPFERLKITGVCDVHPIGDVDRFQSTASKLGRLLKAAFIGSDIWPRNSSATWKLATKLEKEKLTADPDQWLPGAGLKAIGKQKGVKAILELMRNALAHGNLFTRGTSIDEIVFVSFHWKKTPEGAPREWSNFDVLVVSPADLEVMLRKWVDFLNDSDCLRLQHAA